MNRILTHAVLLALAMTLPTAVKAGGFAQREDVREFIEEMREKHGFDSGRLARLFSQAQPQPKAIKAIMPPADPSVRSWQAYRARFIEPSRIEGGLRFWEANSPALEAAQRIYGVPGEIIVAIIGIETIYGRNAGKFPAFATLATLAFDYPPRAEFFRTELEQFLLLSRENRLDPLRVTGSFAGAIGIPQFMPGSQRRYGVDFDADERIDLSASTADAIGSVARFLEGHGWASGQPVAVPALTPRTPDQALLDAGIRPSLKVSALAEQGITADAPVEATVALVDLVSPGRETEYWLGFENFYVITRYNRSSFYAMAVFQLAEAVKARRALR